MTRKISSLASLLLTSALLNTSAFAQGVVLETGTGEAVVVDSEPSQVIYVDPASQGTVVGVPPSLEQRVILESTPQRTVVANPATGDAVRVITVPGQDQPEVLPGMVEINPSSSDIVELEAPAGSAAVISVEDDEQATITQKRTATGQVVPHVKAKKKPQAALPVGAPLPFINIVSEANKMHVGETKDGTYVDIFLSQPGFASFQSTPLKGMGAPLSAHTVATYLNSPLLKDYLMVLASNELHGYAVAKPKRIEALSASHVRVWVDKTSLSADLADKHLQSLTNFHKAHPAPMTAGVIFVSFQAIPTSPDGKSAFAKRFVYFLHAHKGVTLQMGSEGGRPVPQVIFKNVDHITALSALGEQSPDTDASLASIIGTGNHPFKPNGVFKIFKDGKGEMLTLSFDKATYDPKTKNLTFTVSFLEGAPIPNAFKQGHPVTWNHEVTVFMDWVMGGGVR